MGLSTINLSMSVTFVTLRLAFRYSCSPVVLFHPVLFHCFVSLRFVSFRSVLFRFVSFHFILFFVSTRFVSLFYFVLFILFRFAPFCCVSFPICSFLVRYVWSVADSLLAEVMITCEKIRCICSHGEAWLSRESRPSGPLVFYKKAYVEYL